MARISKRRAAMRNDVMDDMDWIPVEIDNDEQLTLLSAVCQVVEVVKNSHNDPRIYEAAARPIAYIKDLLCLTEKQVVAYAIVMDMYYDNQISTFDIARCLDVTPLKAMTFRADLEELCRRNYLVENFDEDATDKSYSVTKEAIASLQQDCAICHRNSTVESAEDWFSALNKIVSARCNRRIDYETLCMRVDDLIKQNDKLPMIKRWKSKEGRLSTEEKMLFFWVCCMVVCSGYETMVPDNFRKLYGDLAVYRTQRKALALGTNGLIKNGLLRIARSGEQRTKDSYELTDQDGRMMELTLTNIDLELLFENYDVDEIKYIDGYSFMASTNLFKDYIMPLYDMKSKLPKGAERELIKLMINSLYGKFGTKTSHKRRQPFLINGIVQYGALVSEESNPVYTAVASFITSYARKQLFSVINSHLDSFIYCDTDSCHLYEDSLPDDIVDPKRLGAWDLEKVYIKAKYLKQKAYMGEKEDGKIDIKLAGCPDEGKKQINFDNFKVGTCVNGKLTPLHVRGGIVLVDTKFTIKG